VSDTRISVSDTVDAPVERVFALLADPDRHPDIDGSGTLRASHTHLAITEVGDVFVVEMEHPERGRYTVENHVVRYEPDQALAWAPAKPGAQPSGHVWSWELTATDDDHTLVTHSHDWSAVTHEPVLERVREVGEEQMHRTIGRLAEVLR
jgi:uncharacterized protein YndB with AHSA1/START domain